jgi:plasmid stabilization system protein ParE
VKPKAVVPRDLARRDVDEAINHYLSEGSPKAALDFVEAIETAYTHLGRQPALESTRYAQELDDRSMIHTKFIDPQITQINSQGKVPCPSTHQIFNFTGNLHPA